MSPLPETPFILHGGCNCKALRYTVSIPALSSRSAIDPAMFNLPGKPLVLPLFNIDHCNDCRRGSGSLVNFFMLAERSTIAFTCLLRDSEEHIQLSGQELLFPSPASNKTFVTHYKSSHNVSFDSDCIRVFCGRCGTNFGLGQDPWKFPIAPTFSIQMGTLDRESLEMEGVRLERHFFCGVGLDWVVKLFSEDAGLTKHPAFNPFEPMQ
jgi:hypothetical protein